jgi:squalene synthase HpnC
LPAGVCEKLAKSHYENFSVGTWLLPKQLRPHVYNVYAYCRVCDDLADEVGDSQLSLRLLDWWREELHKCYEGRPEYPLFVALRPTIEQFELPAKPFEDLISAFVQDQHIAHYTSFEDLSGYCSRSANPVGRLFLRLLGYRDEERAVLSDCTCTALQLTNFWQDIGPDYARGRVYIPLEDLARYGYTEAELRNGVVNASFTRLMRFQIGRTRELFDRGAALWRMIDGPGAADVEMFTRGGMAVLDAIERSHYRVFRKRITISRARKTALIASWLVRRLMPR